MTAGPLNDDDLGLVRVRSANPLSERELPLTRNVHPCFCQRSEHSQHAATERQQQRDRGLAELARCIEFNETRRRAIELLEFRLHLCGLAEAGHVELRQAPSVAVFGFAHDHATRKERRGAFAPERFAGLSDDLFRRTFAIAVVAKIPPHRPGERSRTIRIDDGELFVLHRESVQYLASRVVNKQAVIGGGISQQSADHFFQQIENDARLAGSDGAKDQEVLNLHDARDEHAWQPLYRTIGPFVLLAQQRIGARNRGHAFQELEAFVVFTTIHNRCCTMAHPKRDNSRHERSERYADQPRECFAEQIVSG